MADIKKAIFGNTATNDQPQTKKPDTKGSDETDTNESVNQSQNQPAGVSDSDGPTHEQPTSESQPETSSERTGKGNEDDYYAPSDQTRS